MSRLVARGCGMGRYLMLWLVLLFLSLQVTTGWARQVSHALGVTVINGQPKRVVTLFQGGNGYGCRVGDNAGRPRGLLD